MLQWSYRIRSMLQEFVAMTVMTVGQTPCAERVHAPTVLVIDRDPQVRSSVRCAMNPIGFDTVEAECGAAGLAVVGDDPASVDLVLADAALSDLDGFDVATVLGRLRPELPVVRMSDDADDEDGWEGTAPGPALLHKPLSAYVLRTAVVGILAEAARAQGPACGIRARAERLQRLARLPA